MTTKIVVQNTATLSQLQAAIDDFDEVEFAAGQAFALTGYLSIKSPTKLYSSVANPATIRKSTATARAIVINASGVTLHNLVFDFNSTGGWQNYAAFLNFNIPSGDSQTQNALVGTRILGCDFIDSSGDQTHGGKDSWGIVFTNQAPLGVQDVKVIGCRMLTANRQLTSGGAGGGVNGCEIAYNYVRNGRANSIAVSNRFNDGTDAENDDDILSNINIHHNALIGNYGTGIFVGRDGNDNPDIDVSMSNVTIADNYLELRPASNTFANGILIKSGTSVLSTWSNVSVARNKIINSRANPTTVRIVDFQGPLETVASVSLTDNQITGPSNRGMKNLTIVQSGNTRNGQPYTFTSQT